ncbi:MAG: FHA domain-containing protein [Deltaproteobacteria bacterium]|nr:FHA domain-containing protein [Deltaproteobacteria bacterium]MBI3296493.1 FHA domain-containing protein [Deltaproteobacteria bacterium]
MNVKFKILLNGEVTQEVHWEAGVYRVGRSEFGDLVLTDDSVSRSHLEIRVTEASVYITSMTSAGKVRVNGEIVETAEVNDGDIVRLGRYELLAVFGEAMVGATQQNQRVSENDVPSEAPADGDALTPDGWNNDAIAAEGGPEFKMPEELEPAPEKAVGKIRPAADGTSFRVEGTSALRTETMLETKPIVAKILFSEGPRKGQDLFIDAYEVSLGRSKKADVFIDDEKLSRLHAKITRVSNGFRLIDLSSRHGTFVNGVRILEHPLASFDTIEIGTSKIQFLIQDVAAANFQRAIQGANAVVPLAETRTMQKDFVEAHEVIPPVELGVPQRPPAPLAPPSPGRVPLPEPKRPNRLLLTVAAVGMILIAFVVLLPNPKTKKEEAPKEERKTEIKLPPSIPREFAELSPENQRAVEGYYNSAIAAGDKSNWEDALWNLKKMRDLVPFYKQSIELNDTYARRLKEKQLEETQKKASQNEQADLANYLKEGIEYLKEGNFDLAADAFNQAITLDPTNATAKNGIRAAEYKIKDLEQVPPEKEPEIEKKKAVADIFQTALNALQNKSYQEAIDAGEKIRTIELKGDSKYLNEAKIIIDKAKLLQKEEFEPFLVQAKEKFAEGDYNASRDLCDEMLKRDPAYEEAKECSIRAKKQLNRLAKENYTTGYVLESMNRIEEAKQYWNRAKNFVRPGDPYFDKVMKKLDDYN